MLFQSSATFASPGIAVSPSVLKEAYIFTARAAHHDSIDVRTGIKSIRIWRYKDVVVVVCSPAGNCGIYKLVRGAGIPTDYSLMAAAAVVFPGMVTPS